MLAPIALFVYNRPWHTEQTINALKNNELAAESELIIYSDAAKNEEAVEKVLEVRDYIKCINGFKKITIIERETNWGLANSIIDGVTNIVNKYGKIIVLEDDLVTSRYFLRFMNESLDMYEGDFSVASITGYIYPIKKADKLQTTYFIRGADCWGWATWKRAWSIFEADGKTLLNSLVANNQTRDFDFDNSYGYTDMLKAQIEGKNNSWAIRWYASAYLANMLTLYPRYSYVLNIGNDDSGTHCDTSQHFDVHMLEYYEPLQRIELIESIDAKKQISIFFKSLRPSVTTKMLKLLKKFMR